jgi:hypothetical protein
MGHKPFNEVLMRRYLLGNLRGKRLARIERRLLSDEQFFDELIIAEDELTDEYLLDQLTTRERLEFETRFLAIPERRQKLRFSRALRSYVSGPGYSGRPPVQTRDSRSPQWYEGRVLFWRADSRLAVISVAAPALLLSIAIFVLVSPGLRPDSSPPTFTALQNSEPVAGDLQPAGVPDDPHVEVLPPSVHRPGLVARRRNPGLIQSVVLSSGGDRASGETRRVRIPSNPRARVRMILMLAEQKYQTYMATLQKAGGEIVYRRDHLKPRALWSGCKITIDVEAHIFDNEDYSVILTGNVVDGESEPVGRYPLRALRR